MLHGSQHIGLNWRMFRYLTWIELVIAAGLVILYLAQGHIGRAVNFGVMTLAVYLVCIALNPIPTFYAALAVGAALLNAAGWTLDLFTRIRPYDEIVHALTSIAVTALLGSAVFGPLRPNFGPRRWIFVTAVLSFGVAIGALWEILEWSGYWVVAPDAMQGRTDTTSDLVMDFIGATLGAFMVLRTSGKRWGESNEAHEQLQAQQESLGSVER